MTNPFKLLGLILMTTVIATDVLALVAEPTKVTLWRKSESIGGEEFLAANEAIVDYLATLRRPTEVMKGIKYQCMAKTRTIQPTVRSVGSTKYSYVYVTMVYELRDCVESLALD